MKAILKCSLGLIAIIGGCSGDSKNTKEDRSMFDHNADRSVIRLAATGGYVPPDYAFLDETPYLVIYGDGRFIRRADDPKTQIARWDEGALNAQQMEELPRKIERLGFWEWDSQAIQESIWRNPLIVDLPTTRMEITRVDRAKTFSCYGMREYRETYSLPELLNPVNLCDDLESLKPEHLHLPNSIQIFVMPIEPETASSLRGVVPWPFPDISVVPATEIGPEGYRATLSGEPALKLAKALSRNKYFSMDQKLYLIRYRPNLDAMQK